MSDEETEPTEQDSNPLPNGDNGLAPVQAEGPALSRAEGLAEARDDKGRFLPGNPGGPGNPNARNVAAWRRALADSVSADDIAQVVSKLVEAAKAREPWAVKELLDRCFGKPHVQIELQGDVDTIRQYTEAERIEGKRLTRLLIEDKISSRKARGASPPTPPGA